MKVYSPWDAPKPFRHNNVSYALVANSDTDLPDDAAAHAVKRLGATGVSALTGSAHVDAEIRARAEASHDAYLASRAAELAGVPKPHPDAAQIAAAIARREERRALKDTKKRKGAEGA